MRYFVLCHSDMAGIAPHILAEVVREYSDDGVSRERSVAGIFAGATCEILTQDELLAEPDGALALEAWQGLDDAEFDADTHKREDQTERKAPRAGAKSHLRLVISSSGKESKDRTSPWPSPVTKR